jgi:hypothetical protein
VDTSVERLGHRRPVAEARPGGQRREQAGRSGTASPARPGQPVDRLVQVAGGLDKVEHGLLHPGLGRDPGRVPGRRRTPGAVDDQAPDRGDPPLGRDGDVHRTAEPDLPRHELSLVGWIGEAGHLRGRGVAEHRPRPGVQQRRPQRGPSGERAAERGVDAGQQASPAPGAQPGGDRGPGQPRRQRLCAAYHTRLVGGDVVEHGAQRAGGAAWPRPAAHPLWITARVIHRAAAVIVEVRTGYDRP